MTKTKNIASIETKKKASKAVATTHRAWGTFTDGELNGIAMTRTAARALGTGVAKRITVTLDL